MSQEYSIQPLKAALASGQAFFGHSPISPAPPSHAKARLHEKLRKIFATLPSADVREEGIIHDLNGQVFLELSLGAHAYLVSCDHGADDRLDPVTPLEIVTGICMFGADSIVGHTKSQRYSLTDPSTLEGLNSTLTDITIDERLHVYEAETAARLTSFIADLSAALGGKKITVNIHLPVPEYELYGLTLLARRLISQEDFVHYREAVRSRGPIIQKLIEERLPKTNFELTFGSPLDWVTAIDPLLTAPEQLSDLFYRTAAEQDPLWKTLINTIAGNSLIELNFMSYIYHYLNVSRHCRATGRQLAVVENPDESRIMHQALDAEAATGISLEGTLSFYVHPEVLASDSSFPDDGHLLYNVKNGTSPKNIKLALSPYPETSRSALGS